MSATGIGASVKRKEDIRFITGKGHYVDDVNRPGQAHAYFLRSPHAHATIDKIDTSAALKAPGVVAVFTGDDIAADKIGGLICGWMIHSKDGSPMKAGAHPALAQGKVRYVGDHVAVIIADTYAQAKDAAEKIVVDYGVLPPAVDTATTANAGPAPIARSRAEQHHLQLAHRRQGGDRRGLRRSGACDETRYRQQSPDPERHGAARRRRRVRFGDRRDHALYDEPKPACGAPRALRFRWYRPRAQAARHRARRRRRLRLENLHLCRGNRMRLGGQEDRPAGQMDGASARSPSSPTRMAAIT